LRDLRAGAKSHTARPLPELAHGYVVETLHWSVCTLPDGVQPENQDGEVAAFRRMTLAALQSHLERNDFTIDASLVLLAAHGKAP